jgi:hypothetical protein
MKGLFTTQDSKFTIKTALLVTSVPVLMIAMVVYSIWLLLSMNYSYFRASGFPLDNNSLNDFINYVVQSQIEYLPLVGLFIVAVFFIGMFLSYIILRPFAQLSEMCEEIKNAKGEKIKIIGLSKKKVLIKIGDFLCKYAEACKNNTKIEIPDEIQKIKGPVMDVVYYFQFFCIILILNLVTIGSIYIFTEQLQNAIVETAVSTLNAPKGMSVFLSSQNEVFDLIILVPSVVSCLIYIFLSRLIINKVQGVTYAYVRDICDVARGNTKRRLMPRMDDPGRETAMAVNATLDMLHPRRHDRVESAHSQEVEVPANAIKV